MIRKYCKNKFPSDLRRLHFFKPNDAIISHPDNGIDENTLFFGGSDWKNIEEDIRDIEDENLEEFFLCLFMIISIDMAMYAYFKKYYDTFRRKTMYPKFGWVGFCHHFETPKKILLVPYEKKIVNYSKYMKNPEKINDYVDFLFEEADRFFGENIPEITTEEFFTKMVRDRDFKVRKEDKGTIFEKIVSSIKNKLEERKAGK